MDTKELFESVATTARLQARRVPRDYVAAMVDADAAVDHEAAKQRGHRINDMADHIASNACLMNGRPTREQIKAAAIEVLAASLYGNVAIDMPRLRR